MRYLITGGAGFIGSALARMLAAKGEGVVVIDKLTYAADIRALDPVMFANVEKLYESFSISKAREIYERYDAMSHPWKPIPLPW